MEPQFGDYYKLVWRNANRNIAEVRNYTLHKSNYRGIKVLHDDARMNESRMRFIVSTWAKGEPQIVVSSAFLRLPKSQQIAAIWHEVGHIHYDHDSQGGCNTQQELRQLRISYIQRGKVMPAEIEADDFAVARVGKVPLIKFLSFLLESRPTGAEGGLNDLGKKELELRIARINNVKLVSSN